MVEKVLAGVVVVVCIGLFVRLLIGERRRYRLDAWLQRQGTLLARRARGLWHWRSSRKQAQRVADEAIRRARGEVERDGNVYKPKSFRKPPRDKMH
ncbi:MAG: hypothetical protein KF788_13475 [Piscinibacter sp.]|nr:hypothetical protein [Piscinibacter sp.]